MRARWSPRRAPASTRVLPTPRRWPTSSPRRSSTSSGCRTSWPPAGPGGWGRPATPAETATRAGLGRNAAVARFRIVFVCLGNICRSPMAELAMRRLLDEQGLTDRIEVAIAGTGDYHVGETGDPRAAAPLREH